MLKIEAEKSQKTKQMLSNHWHSNQTLEFCNGQNKKNAIKSRAYSLRMITVHISIYLTKMEYKNDSKVISIAPLSSYQSIGFL